MKKKKKNGTYMGRHGAAFNDSDTVGCLVDRAMAIQTKHPSSSVIRTCKTSAGDLNHDWPACSDDGADDVVACNKLLLVDTYVLNVYPFCIAAVYARTRLTSSSWRARLLRHQIRTCPALPDPVRFVHCLVALCV